MWFLIIGGYYVFTAYRKAQQIGRSPICWALIAGAVFSGTLIGVIAGAGFIFEYGTEFWGWSEHLLVRNQIYISILALFACIFTNWLALRLLTVRPADLIGEPPPPNFEERVRDKSFFRAVELSGNVKKAGRDN